MYIMESKGFWCHENNQNKLEHFQPIKHEPSYPIIKYDKTQKVLPSWPQAYDIGLRTPVEDIAFTAWPKSNSHSQIFRYTHAHLWFPHWFLAVNHHDNKNWVPFILRHNLWLIFMGMKQKEFSFFGKKKFRTADSKKLSFLTLPKAE